MGWPILLQFSSIIAVLQANPTTNTDTTVSASTNNAEDCCDFKMVGGVEYVKISHGAVPAQCKSDCIYERQDKPGSRFCFARGELEMHCMDGGQAKKEWSTVDEITWMTQHTLKVRFSDKSTQMILLNQTSSEEPATGGLCTFTGVMENDPRSAVDISGCRDASDFNVTITSNRFKEGIVFINIYKGKITENEITPYPWDEQMIMGINTTGESKKRLKMAISLWPNRVLWYDLTDVDNLAQKQQIKNVLDELASNVNTRETCIQFREKTYGNRVKVTNKQRDENGKRLGCSSYVGYHHKEDQNLNLNSGSCSRKSAIQHEFFHALGIVHTQQRPDRDQFVRLLKDEKTHENGRNWFRANHAKCENCNTYGVPYDFESIMHYPASSGIQTLDASKQSLIGNNKYTASPDDLEMVRRMYCGSEPPAFVSCGGQFAPSCGECSSSCDGDCGLHNGQCKARVVCGGHKAVTCEQCGDSASWCNGDCTWINGQCKEAIKSCGGHFAPTCGECGSNPSYCNGDCVWTNGECTDVKVSGVSEPCTCKDHPGYQSNCPWWRSHCRGGRYQDWVSTRCPDTCSSCQCCDGRRDLRGSISCANWKKQGFCSHTWVNWMWLNCYKTCTSEDCTDCDPRSDGHL